jgi:hydrogenase expression/formation protein HypC
MCLGTVAKVVEVVDEGRAVVEHGDTQHPGRREDVLKMTVGDDIRPGDWVVIHSGFVLERISEARALDALAIRATPPHTSPPATSPPDTTGSHTTPGASAAPQHKEVAL